MESRKIAELLLSPLTKDFGMIMMLVGLYSLYFNVNAAKKKNYKRCESVARIGGWCYLILGAAVLMRSFI